MGSLTLAAPTSPLWLDHALVNLDLILLDHANCEKKAAGNALSLMFRYPTHTDLVAALSPLAREELQHFEKVQRQIQRLGIPVKKLTAAPYATRCSQHMCKQDPDALLDALVMAAIIEARSHERLALLGEHCPDLELRQFYQWLAEAESRHWRLYVDLAELYFPPERVQQRLDDLTHREAEVLAATYQPDQPYPPARIHS
ncbi:MAG: tRNA isopentenyl-2-thiomethyl-A-37 hydroxylase MiaE [Synechococcales cyanobacterium]